KPQQRRSRTSAERRWRCLSTLPIQMPSKLRSVENRFGPIDIWVNCAMATIFVPFHRISAEEYRRATEVTYLGFVYGTMAALKRMRPRAPSSWPRANLVGAGLLG